MNFKALKAFQDTVNRLGFGGSTLALPAPSTLALPDYSSSGNDIHEKYLVIVNHQGIIDVSRDLFVSGFYSESVDQVFKLLDDIVKTMTSLDISGTALMDRVFSPKNPIILLNDLSSESKKNEQAGYHRLFSGSMLGIRNPGIHELGWFEDPQNALEVIVLCQHLCRKLEGATLTIIKT